MKNSSETIGNRNRDLPACSAVPQPTESIFNYIQQHSNIKKYLLKVVYLKKKECNNMLDMTCRTFHIKQSSTAVTLWTTLTSLSTFARTLHSRISRDPHNTKMFVTNFYVSAIPMINTYDTGRQISASVC